MSADNNKYEKDYFDPENGDVDEILDRMEEVIASARLLPFSDNCIVDREQLLIYLSFVREKLPLEIRQAKILLEQSRTVMLEAQKKAEAINREAERRMTEMINEHEITKKAVIASEEIIGSANDNAAIIRTRTLDYARKKLSDLEEQLTSMLVTVQKNKKELK